MSQPTNTVTDADEVPPEVEAEFDQWLDRYIAEWTQDVLAQLEQQSANASRMTEANFSVPLDGRHDKDGNLLCKCGHVMPKPATEGQDLCKCDKCGAIIKPFGAANERFPEAHKHDAIRNKAADIYRQALQAVLGKYEALLLGSLKKQAGNEQMANGTSLGAMFPLDDFSGDLLASLFSASESAYAQCAKGSLDLLGENQIVTKQGVVTQFALDRANKLKQCPQEIFDNIQDSLNEGIDAGETPDELADRVQAEFRGISRDRAELIANTEAQAAYGTAQFNTLEDMGSPTKRWITSHDELVRPSHVSCEAEGSIDMGDEFENGLKYPGDSNGSAGETINCRCYLAMGETEKQALKRVRNES